MQAVRLMISLSLFHMEAAQKKTITESEKEFRRIQEWAQLTREEQENVLSQVEGFQIESEKKVYRQEYYSDITRS